MKIERKWAGILAVVCIAFTALSCGGVPPAPAYDNPDTLPEVAVDVPGLFSIDPDSPDGDQMFLGIDVVHSVPIKDWTIVIDPDLERLEFGQDGQDRERDPFFQTSGTGAPPDQWGWDGKSSRNPGELVQSGTAYKFTLTVRDIFDNTNSYDGVIEVDIMVKQDGDDLRILVPAIVFPPNSAKFDRLTPEQVKGNLRAIALIADVLNKYDEYAITIEGHTNPITAPGTAARTAEEAKDVPLSQQRAQTVIDYLKNEHKIHQNRLTIVGRSCTRPIADYVYRDENWKNRRVEFILQK